MDNAQEQPSANTLPQFGKPSFFSKHKKLIVIGAAIAIVLVIIIAIIILTPGNRAQDSDLSEAPAVTPTLTPPPEEQARIDVQNTAQDIIQAINAENIDQAVEELTMASIEPETKDTLVEFYKTEREYFSDDGVYEPIPVENGVQVYGTQAQILLEEKIQGNPVQIRRDLVYTKNGWKIEDTQYNKPLDLKEQHEARVLEQDLLTDAEFSEAPTRFTLPNGDVLEIFRTYWLEGANPYDNTEIIGTTTFSDVGEYDFVSYQDFLFLLSFPKQDYTVVLFDAPYIRHVANIKQGTNSGNYGPYQSFDIREVEEDDGKAVLLVYEGSIPINDDVPGVPQGWVLSIPIWIR